jgi:hypothetical protein
LDLPFDRGRHGLEGGPRAGPGQADKGLLPPALHPDVTARREYAMNGPGPRLTGMELLDLDRRLRELHAALTSKPNRAYGFLSDEARGVLRSVEQRLVNPGLDKESSGRWGWEAEWRGLGCLTWSRFGSQDVPVWKAMHEAFTELVRFTLDASVPGLREEYGRRLARSLRVYLELAGHWVIDAHGEPEWSAPRGVKEWARVFGRSAKTVGRWFSSGRVRVRRLSRQSYQVALDDIPSAHRERERARASR